MFETVILNGPPTRCSKNFFLMKRQKVEAGQLLHACGNAFLCLPAIPPHIRAPHFLPADQCRTTAMAISTWAPNWQKGRP